MSNVSLEEVLLGFTSLEAKFNYPDISQWGWEYDENNVLKVTWDSEENLNKMETTLKLELCAFALKGEHNVYSLVPNIAVYMYIYIDTKFSMHVIDPSRKVLSHCMTV